MVEHTTQGEGSILLHLNLIVRTCLLFNDKIKKAVLLKYTYLKIEGVEIEEGEADEEGEGDEDEVDNAAAGGEGEEVAKKTYLRFTERDYT